MFGMNKKESLLLRKFLLFLLPYRRKYLISLAFSFLATLSILIIPYLSKLAVDDALINKNMRDFILIGLAAAVIFFVNGFLKAIATFFKKGIRLKVRFDLNKRVFEYLQNSPLSFFWNKSTGEHIFKINYDIEKSIDLVIAVPEDIVSIFPKLLLILGILLYLDWQMTLALLIFMPFIYLPIRYFTRLMRKTLEELLADSQSLLERLREVFSHMYLIKAFGKEKKEISNYIKSLTRNTQIHLRGVKLQVLSSLTEETFGRLAVGAMTFFAGYQVIRARISLGTFTAIVIYATQLIKLQANLALFFQRISLGLVSCRRLDQMVDEDLKTKNESQDKLIVSFKNPRIEFKNVSFTYKKECDFLKNLSFTIEKGFNSLVGASGCGKTTVINLLLKLYEPCQGQICIEGHSLRDLNPSCLKGQIAVSLQEPFLWNDSILNNIKYARPDASRNEIIECAKIAGVDDFLKGLNRGYETIVGENSCKLSEGQKQKIAIARALIKKPKILILDEAMSSMDSLSEEKITSRITKLPIYSTIVISHRLSTIMASTLVYFIKNPETVIIGPPFELIRKDKDFHDLFSAQIAQLSDYEPSYVSQLNQRLK